MARFDKFTQPARRLLSSAQSEAQRLNHDAIGTEHLLLGLTRYTDGIAPRVLAAMGVELPDLRSAVERVVAPREDAPVGDVGLTPGCRLVLELAIDESHRLGHDHVGSEHLLLGLLREREGIAFGVLDSLGVALEPARAHVRDLTGSARKAAIFGALDEQARLALTMALDESRRLNHNYIGTEHLLLGLVRVHDGVAARVLGAMGAQLPKARAAVEFIIGRGEGVVTGARGLTPRARKVVELAIDESRRLNHSYIGTEHLLLGIVREGEGIAAGVLESLGVDLDEVRVQVMQVIAGPSGRPDADGPPEPP